MSSNEVSETLKEVKKGLVLLHNMMKVSELLNIFVSANMLTRTYAAKICSQAVHQEQLNMLPDDYSQPGQKRQYFSQRVRARLGWFGLSSQNEQQGCDFSIAPHYVW